MLGIVDITGSAKHRWPVRAGAGAGDCAGGRGRLASARGGRRASPARVREPPRAERSAVALISPGGRLLAATPARRDRFAAEAADAGALSSVTEGRLLVAEAVGPAGHLMVHFSGMARPRAAVAGVRLTALGRDCALVEVDGRTLRLRPRHSEIVVILALA